MEFFTYLVGLSVLVWSCFYVLKSNSRHRRLPPGPIPFPIIGNILELGQNPHQSLAKLSKKYGPLMHLKLGSMNAIVVSSPEIAKEILQKHDQVFSGRPNPAASEAYNHNRVSMVWLPTTSRWRILRKICKEQMFSVQRLDSSQSLRQEKLRRLREYVQECCDSSQVVDIADAAFTTSLNLVSASLFSIDFAEFNSDSSQELKEIVHGMMKVVGTPNLSDYFPVLKPIDPQGIKRKSEAYAGKMLRIFDDIINQRLETEGVSMSFVMKNDLLQALLDLNQRGESDLSRNELIHLLLDLFVAGTDTTATTVEWVMTELMRNPEKMSRARKELQDVIGENKQLEESNISRLPYLRAICEETFRLHPAGPLLVPHKVMSTVEVNEYMIPKNAQILVNVWTIARDPSIWSNPDFFEPERFLGSKIDFRGQDFELIPFGSGRRICPGLPLAYRMVHLMVASLIHNFDWELEAGMKPEEMDLSEKFELSLQKAVPLKAVPIKL